jgi:hypothetical protein
LIPTGLAVESVGDHLDRERRRSGDESDHGASIITGLGLLGGLAEPPAKARTA